MKKGTKLICTLALTAAVTGTSGIAVAVADGGSSYYVCYSTENYSVRNANKMTEEDGEFYIYDVTLNSLTDFFVTDDAGRRWYASDGKEMSVGETLNYSYNIKFSPDKIYSEYEAGEWEVTDCNITYSFYTPAEYSVNIGGEEFPLTYNPYRTEFDEYYISSQYITGGTDVIYEDEVHSIEHDGFYRITFTPGENANGNDYAYNSDGAYGSGGDYSFKLYIEDAPQYFLLPDGEGEDYLPLTRYENNTSAIEYRSEEFFVGERDYTYRYAVYEQSVNGTYRLIDDDNDKDTAVSKINIQDAGWYEFCFIDGGERFSTATAYKKRNFGGFYAAGEFNGYCYDENGYVDTDSNFLFKKVEDGDGDYDNDYEQYVLNLTISEKSLKDGDVEFYITDGENIYKNGTEYIKISRAGEYKILFSDEHIYGNGRRYRYVLVSDEKDYTELEIGTAEQFIEFAENCSASAEYSKNLAVYLTADIDFSATDFVSVGEFSGKFYGGYHTLENIELSKDNPSLIKILKRDALFERVNIKNISLTDKDVDFSGVIGKNYGTVANVNVYGNITGNNYVGAVVAYNGRSAENENTGSTDTNTLYRYGEIKNCKNYAKVSGTVHCGGICGFNAGEIFSCENNAEITYRKQSSSSTPFNIGGIAGYSAGKITACQNFGEVAGGSENLYAGGICGLCTGEIYYSFNNARVSGRRYTGGVVGYYGTLNNSEDSNNFFGGLSYEEIYNRYFGNDDNDFEQISGNNQIIKYCVNYGEVTSVSYAGGVAGFTDVNTLKISCCENEGNVFVTAGSYAGGIIGCSTGAAIESCLSGGRISAKGLNAGNYVGGIAGYGNNITACSSVSELIGNDYIGGIAGYNQSGLSSCWSNVIIIPSSEAKNTGNIAGFTEALNEAADNFSVGFENNYYIENATDKNGGICGRSYGKSYGFAAAPIASEELAYKGVVSPYLSDGFNAGERWQGSEDLAYPVPRYLIESEECEEFDDDEQFLTLFGLYSDKLSSAALKNSQALYTVSFLEWNEDNGSLYDDDGVLQIDNFDVILSLRLPLGEVISAPEFKWAYSAESRYIYDGNDASYFVSFPETGVVVGSTAIYAQYREIATTIATADDKILVEGEFDVETNVELISSVNGYALKFTLNGEQIEVGTVKVKFLPNGDVNNCKVQVTGSDGTTVEESEVYGNYIGFSYSDGDYFSLVTGNKKSGLPSWAWAIIGGAIGAVIVAAAFLSPMLIKKIKRRKTAKAAQTESSESREESEAGEETDKTE